MSIPIHFNFRLTKFPKQRTHDDVTSKATKLTKIFHVQQMYPFQNACQFDNLTSRVCARKNMCNSLLFERFGYMTI